MQTDHKEKVIQALAVELAQMKVDFAFLKAQFEAVQQELFEKDLPKEEGELDVTSE